MSMRKDGPGGKPGMLDLRCTVFFPLRSEPELAAAAEVYYPPGVTELQPAELVQR